MEIIFGLMNISILLFTIYLISVSFFLILENRKPQSTFAWLFLFITLPVLGLLIYIFMGRSWRAFSKENKLSNQEIGTALTKTLIPIKDRHKHIANRIAKENPNSHNKKLLQLIENNSNSILTEYNDVEILQDASEKYPRLLKDIKSAKHSVHLEYYIWSNDDFTQELKEILIEKVKKGVKVRALYDASSAKAMGKEYREELIEGGVDIRPYLEYSRLRTIHNIQYRSHRKIVIIDGEIGYIGGLNLDKEQLDGPKGFSHWRDTHLRIHGEAALALQASFVISWYNSSRIKITGKEYFPKSKILKEVKTFKPIQISQSGPDSRWSGLKQTYFFLIMAANETIQIQSPFFIPDESILEAIKSASLAGVEVQMIFQPRGGTFQVPYRAAYTYYKELAEAGAKIYLYQNETYFHPKTINIDSSICSIGSANWDIRSFNINYEINAILYDEKLAKELAKDFSNDLKHCTEFSLEDYKNSSVLRRFTDSLYRLGSPLM